MYTVIYRIGGFARFHWYRVLNVGKTPEAPILVQNHCDNVKMGYASMIVPIREADLPRDYEGNLI